MDNYVRLYGRYYNELEEKDLKPSEAKEKIIKELNESLTRCLNLQLFGIGNISAGEGYLTFKKEDSDSIFSFNVLSAGEKEVVDILLDLYLRKEDYDDTIFLIDEPELHLNSVIQRKFLNEINNLIGEKCQIWIATHSIGFLRALKEDFAENSQIIYFNSNNKWASEKYVLKPEKMTRKRWNEIFRVAIDDMINLISPKTIIYCEGRDIPKNDGTEQGLDAIIYDKIFGETYTDVAFVSSGGNTELEQRSGIAIEILNKVISDVEILVLRDRDFENEKIYSLEDRENYLSKMENKNKRMLKRFEIENYLFDKEILKKYCISNGLFFDELKYDLEITDIVNDRVKDKYAFIKECCNQKISIGNDLFKKKLADFITSDTEVYKEVDEALFRT